MDKEAEMEELKRLHAVRKKILGSISELDHYVSKTSHDLRAQKAYIWENKGEKNAMYQSIMQISSSGEAAVTKRERLVKLLDSPYFGRIDFEAPALTQQVYIGLHAFSDPDDDGHHVYDWRAPVSSLFYDYELGAAAFESPDGTVDGTVKLKRQYRIRNGELEFVLENSTAILDQVLQQELSRSSDDKMKHIIATIQRDQNVIIRNDHARTMIIQGVAGSGKTSIALHRIAFLLYRFRDSINAGNVLIISPNKVFADYISNVLPELGEDKAPEIGIDELAVKAFGDKLKYQTFFEQVSLLLENKDEAFAARIRFKASFAFLNSLNQYITFIGNEYFVQDDIQIGKHVIAASVVKEKFEASHRLPVLKRFAAMAELLVNEVRFRHRYEMSAKDRNQAKKSFEKMFRVTNLKGIYKDFYQWMGKTKFLQTAEGGKMEYSDVFPLLYLRIRLEGADPYHNVRHLLVDEMQDYTPVQYAVISKLFLCKKTILGDVGQSVNPFSASDLEDMQKAFPEAELVKLNKSYRSTYEITTFAQRIASNPDHIPVERHGSNPVIVCFSSEEEEMQALKAMLTAFKSSQHKSLGIICKTQGQAQMLFDKLLDAGHRLNLLTQDSIQFKEGAVITSAHMAKGLEFDRVVVPFCNAANYNTIMDKKMLYVACTRAMHELTVSCAGELTSFIPDEA